jgi:hypothetical protein
LKDGPIVSHLFYRFLFPNMFLSIIWLHQTDKTQHPNLTKLFFSFLFPKISIIWLYQIDKTKLNKLLFQCSVSKDGFCHHMVTSDKSKLKQISFSVSCFQRWFFPTFDYIKQTKHNIQTKQTSFSEFCFQRFPSFGYIK